MVKHSYYLMKVRQFRGYAALALNLSHPSGILTAHG